jgi:hypothetical protein
MADMTAAPSNGAQPATLSTDPSLHQHAVDAERSLEQLATGLAQAGVADPVVKTFTQFAEVTRKLVAALGQGQEQTADNAPPADQALAPSPPSQPRTIHGAAAGMLSDMSGQGA